MNGLITISRKKSKSFWKQMKMNSKQSNLMGHSKDSPERKFIAIEAYIRKREKSEINNLTLYLQEPEKQQRSP